MLEAVKVLGIGGQSSFCLICVRSIGNGLLVLTSCIVLAWLHIPFLGVVDDEVLWYLLAQYKHSVFLCYDGLLSRIGEHVRVCEIVLCSHQSV